MKSIRALHPHLPALMVSMHDESIYAERALRAGARGYVMKAARGIARQRRSESQNREKKELHGSARGNDEGRADHAADAGLSLIHI